MAYNDKTYRGNDAKAGMRHAGVKGGDGFSAGGSVPGVKKEPMGKGLKRKQSSDGSFGADNYTPPGKVDGDGYA